MHIQKKKGKKTSLNSLKIEHLSNIIPKTQIWPVVNFPVFMFVYIHFSVPRTRVTDLVRL